MNDFFTDLFVKIAKRLGLTIQPKDIETMDFYDVNNLSISAMLSERLSTITLTDSTIEVAGDSARAKWLDEFAQNFWDIHIKPACVFSLGTGDCLLKPSITKDKVAVDIIGNQDFAIVENVGDYVTGMVIRCDELWKGSAHYERMEYQQLERAESGGTNCRVYQMAYRNGEEVPMTDVPEWADMLPEILIPNVDKLLLGRITCPTINRGNINSPNGVPITYGLKTVSAETKSAYARYNKEFDDKETLLFADKSMLKRDSDGNISMPKKKNNLFMTFRGDPVDGAKKVDTFSPDIRDGSLDAGIERNFRMLEMGCGLGEGVLSKSTLSYTNVDEVRASRSATYAFMTNFRKAIDRGTEDLLEAVNILANANNITPLGDWEYISDWSDSYMETAQNRFNQLLQSEAINAISKAELRAWVQSENLSTAQEKIDEILESGANTIEQVKYPDLE